MSKLDRTRPYGEQFPSGLFEQDYKLFDRAGNEVSPPPPEPAPDPVVIKAEEDAASEARKIDLAKKENAKFRPSVKAKVAK